MAEVTLDHGFVLAAVLFSIGLLGVMIRRNLIFMLMSVEIMLSAAALAFVLAGQRLGLADGQVMFVLILAMSAAEVSVGLALILRIFRVTGTIDADSLRDLSGWEEVEDE